jgi:hypothetical protein
MGVEGFTGSGQCGSLAGLQLPLGIAAIRQRNHIARGSLSTLERLPPRVENARLINRNLIYTRNFTPSPIPIPTAPKVPEPGPPRGRYGGCQHKGMTLNSTGPWNKLLARVYIYRTYAIYTPLFFCISL